MNLLKLTPLLLCVFGGNGLPSTAVNTESSESFDSTEEASLTADDATSHHYSAEIIDEHRRVTCSLETGETANESDVEVVRILEMVQKNTATELFTSYNIPSNSRNEQEREEPLAEESRRGPRAIIGRDNRIRIPHAYRYPFCAMGQLFTDSTSCTLVLVGPRHALTAAHCVYDTSRQRVRTSQHAYIGRSCKLNGKPVAVQSVSLYNAYISTGNVDFDMAWVLLSQRFTAGCHMGIAFRDPMPARAYMHTCGYPTDQPKVHRHTCLYCSSCRGAQRECRGPLCSRTCTAERMVHSCDVAGGMSGGPVYTRQHDETHNVYVYGVSTHSNAGGNKAVRISKQKFADTCAWLTRTEAGVCGGDA